MSPETTVLLARLQFAFTIAFHYLFPPLTIGLGLLMVIMEGSYLVTKNRLYESMAKFWTKIFALIFAIGVASGIVMEFQFGTNWSQYSRFVGDIFGAALAAEGIFAFFLESGFLAVLVFGWDRVSPAMHFFSTLMVSLGSIFSAVWIIVANSWQQTPAGYRIVEQVMGDGSVMRRAELTNFWEAVLNPSTVERLTHTLVGAFIAGGFLVLSVSAYYLLRGRHTDWARGCMRIAMPFTLVWSIAALTTGHANAKMVGVHQPPKLAAMEGVFDTKENTPLYLFGIVDVEGQTVRYGVPIPGMLGFLLYGQWGQPVEGLHNTPRDEWPPIQITFQAYHAMVGLGMFFILLSAVGMFLQWRGTLYQRRWLLRIFVVAVLGPMIANQLGWVAAEVGRQPWIVWGELKTADAVSPAVKGEHVLASIIMFGVIYLLLLLTWLFVMDRKIRHGPETPEQLEAAAAAARQRGWLDIARARADRGGASMTDARDEDDDKRS
jgi:cytochrome d ubiquinol oxidase subunit I